MPPKRHHRVASTVHRTHRHPERRKNISIYTFLTSDTYCNTSFTSTLHHHHHRYSTRRHLRDYCCRPVLARRRWPQSAQTAPVTAAVVTTAAAGGAHSEYPPRQRVSPRGGQYSYVTRESERCIDLTRREARGLHLGARDSRVGTGRRGGADMVRTVGVWGTADIARGDACCCLCWDIGM